MIARLICCNKCGRESPYGAHRYAHQARALLKALGWYTGCRGPTGHARYQTGPRDYCPCVRAKRGPIVTDIEEVNP